MTLYGRLVEPLEVGKISNNNIIHSFWNILRTKSGACTSSSPLRVASVVNAIAKCPQKNMV